MQELLMGISLCLIKSSQNIFNFREREDFEQAALSKLECSDVTGLTSKFYVTSEEMGLQTNQPTQAPFYFFSGGSGGRWVKCLGVLFSLH